MIEAVEPPERLAVDDDEGRSEYTAADRLFDVALQRFLHQWVVDRRGRRGGIEAFLRRHGNRIVGHGNVDVVDEEGMEVRLDEPGRRRRIARFLPDHDSCGRLRWIGEPRWHPE